ncbi:hypothetical protein PBI_SCTP2_112 [Salicola phage SCTP-2]|nr:hypothetical protein PBI_SCTP2_112 [Salicola phage SCTP-2]
MISNNLLNLNISLLSTKLIPYNGKHHYVKNCYSINSYENLKFLLNYIAITNDHYIIQYIDDIHDELSLYAVNLHYNGYYNNEKIPILGFIKNQNYALIRKALIENLPDEIDYININIDDNLERFIYILCRSKSVDVVTDVLGKIKLKSNGVQQDFIKNWPRKEIIKQIKDMDTETQIVSVKKNRVSIQWINNPTYETLEFAIKKSLECVFAIYEANIELHDELKLEVLNRYWYYGGGPFTDDVYDIIMNKMGGSQSKWLNHKVKKLKLSKEHG